MPDNGRIRLEVTLEHGLAEKFTELCRKRRMSRSEVIRSLIRNAGRDERPLDRIVAQNEEIVSGLGLLLERLGVMDGAQAQRSVGSPANRGSAS